MSIEIERRSNLTREEFQARYVAKSRPVILVDAIDHWPARGKWNLDYFETQFAQKQVTFDQATWRVGDFIKQLKQFSGDGPAPYLKEVKLDEQFPELWADVGDLVLARGNRLTSRFLPFSMRIDRGIIAVFIGTKGSGFRQLHWDYSYLHVFISQVCGGKDAILFSPRDTPYLYPNPEYENKSMIPDPFDVDTRAFPEFSHATPTRVTIGEGETLFLPAGWWHATRITEPSIAIAESTLDQFNWNIRKNWYLQRYEKEHVSALKCKALNVYLELVGRVL